MALNSTPVPFALDHLSYSIQSLANVVLLLSICRDNKNNVLELLIHCLM